MSLADTTERTSLSGAVLDAAAPWGWDPGLRPSDDAPVWRMDSFRDEFLHTYGPEGHTGTARTVAR